MLVARGAAPRVCRPGARPRPGSDHFNELVLCTLRKGDDVCGEEHRACFFDDACDGEMNRGGMPSPVNSFVEDLVRNVVLRLKSHKHITWYKVEAENFESIHNHNAYASIEKG